MIAGRRFFVDGMINFTPVPRERRRKLDGTYRTAFGPCYSHNGEIYEDSDHNMKLAMTRLCATREPQRPGYHQYLYALQEIFHYEHRAFFGHLQELYAPYFDGYRGIHVEAHHHHADPHPKRELRVQAWRELQEGAQTDRLWLRRVLCKLKKNEVAKAGKKPARTIVDLGVAASLQGFYVTGLLKAAQAAEPVHLRGGVLQFVKSPNPWVLDKLFHTLLSPPGTFHFVYFSDDACFSVRIGQKVFVFNLDIKKCDASHQRVTFETLVSIVPPGVQDDLRVLTEQCQLPMEIRSSSTNERVILRPKQPRLYSGSTLTTVINNLANLTIGCSLAEVDWGRVSPENLEAVILRAAERCGYMVSIEACEKPEDIQFLKNSPVFDIEGKMRPLLNIGVLLRASGVCKGDLPGRGDILERATNFQRSLLQGAYPRVRAPFIDGMKDAVSTGIVTAVKDFEYKVEHDATYPAFTVTNAALFRRYSLSDQEITELQESTGYGVTYHHCLTGAGRILSLDYGLSHKERR